MTTGRFGRFKSTLNLLVTSSVAVLAMLTASGSSVRPRVGSLTSATTLAGSRTFPPVVALRLDALERVLKGRDENLAPLVVRDL